MQSTDVLIIGAGMAGASAAYYLAPHVRVLVLEREAQPGYHATGRSAAMYSETYGNATVRAITTASKPFYVNPPPGFSDYPLVTPRGALTVGTAPDHDHLRALWQDMRALVPNVQWWTQADILQRVPVMRPEMAHCGVFEPDALDMDVHAIHQGFLRGAKAAGAQLVTLSARRVVVGGWTPQRAPFSRPPSSMPQALGVMNWHNWPVWHRLAWWPSAVPRSPVKRQQVATSAPGRW
jgi:D-arginine dehydrogenase